MFKIFNYEADFICGHYFTTDFCLLVIKLFDILLVIFIAGDIQFSYVSLTFV